MLDSRILEREDSGITKNIARDPVLRLRVTKKRHKKRNPAEAGFPGSGYRTDQAAA
jgi:hypothetical protein